MTFRSLTFKASLLNFILWGFFVEAYAVGPSPTKTTAQMKVVGDPGHRLVEVIATVRSAGRPVTGGTITLFVNGVSYKKVQLIGLHPAAGKVAGTAEMRVSLTTGSYRLSVGYSGTSQWSSSAAPPEIINMPTFSEASLEMQPLATSSGYSFRFVTTDNTKGLRAVVALSDVASGISLISKELSINHPLPKVFQNDIHLTYPPSTMLMTDLMGNGMEDLVLADDSSQTINVYLQEADGSYKPKQRILVGRGPSVILAEDINQDGLLDLIVLNSVDSTVSKLLQDAGKPGTWIPDATPSYVGKTPISMITGDFNRDGLPDIVVANFADNTLSFLLNQQDKPGAFASGPILPTRSGPIAIAAGEILGNGNLDLAVANFVDETVSLFSSTPNDPNLFHILPNAINVGKGPRNIVICDLNKDGLPDLAVSNSLDGTVSILLATPDAPGVFATQQIQDGFESPIAISAQLVPDAFNAPDLTIGDAETGDLTVLHNDGFGRFLTRTAISVGSAGRNEANVSSSISGAFTLAVSDPSLKTIHLIRNAWVEEGSLAPKRVLDRGMAHRIQVSLSTPSGSTLVSGTRSNILPTKKSQVITFPKIGPLIYGVAPFDLIATSTSTLPVRFVLKAGGDLQNGKLAIRWALPTVIEADQDGNDEFAPAAPVQQTIVVYRSLLTIVPDSITRDYGVPNPPFSGHVEGGPFRGYVAYSSQSNALTPAGVYQHFPVGISGAIEDPLVLANFYVQSQVGTLTICPSPESSIQDALPNKLNVEASLGSSSCANISPIHPSPAPVDPISSKPTPEPTPRPSSPPVVPPVPNQPTPGPNPVPVSPLPIPITPGPNPAPLPTPIEPQQSSPSIATKGRFIPLPAPLPIKVSRKSAQPAESVLLIALHSKNLVPGWISVKLNLECPHSMNKTRNVLFSTKGSTISEIHTRTGESSIVWVRVPEEFRELRADFLGDSECKASSNTSSVSVRYRNDSIPVESSFSDSYLDEVNPNEYESSPFDPYAMLFRPIETDYVPMESFSDDSLNRGECGVRDWSSKEAEPKF